jgi:aryl-alcohol dehydrogenase-like predicted oxidoreductase
MKYRNFKGHPIAEVGLGTWQLGSAEWGVIHKEQAFEILQAYVDAGGNFIDTADIYGMGVSEQIIGEFIQTTDRPIYVATKLGRRGDGTNGWPQNFSYDAIRSHVETSLQNLQVSSLFIEQFHCIPIEELKKGEVFSHLRKLKEEGLIQHIGVSVETAEEALICLQYPEVDSLQIIFNLFRQHIADEFFEQAQNQEVALIARVPLASGLLSGKFSASTVFQPSDHRHFNADGAAFNVGETFSGVPFDQGLLMVEALQNMLPDGVLASQAIRWILDHPAITTVIPGASKASQIQTNTAASALAPFDASVHAQLRAYYDESIRPKIRGPY